MCRGGEEVLNHYGLAHQFCYRFWTAHRSEPLAWDIASVYAEITDHHLLDLIT